MPLTEPVTIARESVVPVEFPACGDVLAVLDAPVLLADDGLRVEYVNAAAVALLGPGAGALVGRVLPELISGDYAAEPPRLGHAWRCQRLRRGWLVHGCAPSNADDGWMRRMIEAEQLAAVGQVAAGVAHEIGAPLTAISVAVEYLIRGVDVADAGVRRDLEMILAQTQRISRLTRRLVELAKPSEPEFRRVELNAVVRESLEFTERQFQRDGIEPAAELGDDVGSVCGDAHQLQQVVLNLLLNAHRALLGVDPSERRLSVRTARRGDDVELIVQDTGPGIDPDDLQRIFLPFFSRAQSTGMGLTVVRNIVYQHRGTVEAQSGPARGASFHVRIPAMDDDDDHAT
jgi:signal transduction histidine kinase